MTEANLKEVEYSKYCPRCVNRKKDETLEPCNECLTVCARCNSRKPLYFEGRASKLGKSK